MAGKRRARATTSWNERALRTRETHGRITSGVHRVHGAEHDAYILIAVIHRVGWPTSAALWVCPWEMAKTTCKESPRNKTTFEYPFSLSSNQPATLFYANPCDSLAPSSPFPYPFWPSSSPFSFFFFLIVVVLVGENIEVWKSFCEWKSFFLSENIFPDRYNCGVLLRENIPSFFQNSNFCQKSIHSRLISRLKVIWIKYILILLKVFF